MTRTITRTAAALTGETRLPRLPQTLTLQPAASVSFLLHSTQIVRKFQDDVLDDGFGGA